MKHLHQLVLAVAIAGSWGAALAAEQRHAPRRPGPAATAARPMTGPIHLDQRYQHDHYYPSRGFPFRSLPNGSVGLAHGGGNWFFHAGVWFRPVGGRYIVDLPPVGIVVPFLPPAYATVWVGGIPYYYANGVYYANVVEGYVVAAPPRGAEAAVPAEPVYFIYPRNAQSAQQTDADRAACNGWATSQPGTVNDADAFQRAFAACMDGRGYTVR